MASSKQRQEMAKAARKAQKEHSKNPNATILKANGAVRLYNVDDILIDNGYPIVHTPDGIQAYKTALVNISYIPRGRQTPTHGFQTGYGCSYMAKVMSGTPRAREIMINVFANNDETGDMLQISATEESTKYNEGELVSQAVCSLPLELRKKFANVPLTVESGTSPVPLGFAKILQAA